MNNVSKLLFASIPVFGLAACGSGDVAQSLGTADPQVRLAHVAPAAPNLTLQRNGGTRSEATNVPYGFVSNYFSVDTGSATWTVSGTTNTGNAGTGFSQSVNFDAQRGHKYTIAAVNDSPTATSLVTINDPTNLNLVSDDSRFRVLNASFNAQNIDVYLIGLNETVGSKNPTLSSIGFKNTGPGNGTDALKSRGGTYQVVVTTAGTKTVLFRGQQEVPDNRDVLFVTVPNSVTNPTGINLLVKLDGTAGATQVSRL